MIKKLTYKHTTYACYMAYITGAIINNFAPLLFVIFSTQFNLSFERLAVLISLNFGTQIAVDFLGAKYVDRIGYRRTFVIALFMSALGLCFLGSLVYFIPPFLALIISVICYAIGSGLLEVMVSPTVEALPNDAKSSQMSLLHSFFCWGSMLVIIVSTMFFNVFGIENWQKLCFLWAIVPATTLFLFLWVPIIPFGNAEHQVSFGKIFSSGYFKIFILIMLCAGASEIAMSQWASIFAETGLGVSKTTGDILGPCMFAATMGIFRVLYGKYGKRVDLYTALVISSAICILGYLTAVFAPNPIVSLLGCGICGAGVAIMWPGTLSLAAEHCAFGGTAIFGLLAMAGDTGCCLGPSIVAVAAQRLNLSMTPLKAGLFCATIFPTILMISVMVLKRKLKNSR